MKILTISSRNHPGVSSVFFNFVRVIPESKHLFLQDISEDYLFEEELVILGAWDNEFNKILPKIKGKKAILWTSSTFQMSLTPNLVEVQLLEYVKNLLNQKMIDYLFVGDRRLVRVFPHKNILFFPYPIHFIDYPPNEEKWESKEIRIGLHTINHPRKNILNQHFAFLMALKKHKEIQLHTNCPIFQNQHNTYVYGWLKKEDYDQEIDNLNFSLSVFPFESFCYSFSEMMMRGIPTIHSLAIANNFKLYLGDLLVFDCDDAEEIADRINYLCSMTTQQKKHLSKQCREHIKNFSEKQNKELIAMLRECE